MYNFMYSLVYTYFVYSYRTVNYLEYCPFRVTDGMLTLHTWRLSFDN